MKTDPRLEEEDESPEQSGLLQRFGQAITARKLRMLDGIIGFFQGWRNGIAPPEEEDDWRSGGKRKAAGTAEPAPLGDLQAAPHGGLRRFLIVVALLLATGIAGMLFSYSLLSRIIGSDELVIDDLREQLVQMRKADARNISIQAKDQVQIAEQKKTIREYEAKLQEYEDQIAQLRQQIAALTPRRETGRAVLRPLRAPQRELPQKTGKCTATGSSAAADVARCVQDFNRP